MRRPIPVPASNPFSDDVAVSSRGRAHLAEPGSSNFHLGTHGSTGSATERNRGKRTVRPPSDVDSNTHGNDPASSLSERHRGRAHFDTGRPTLCGDEITIGKIVGTKRRVPPPARALAGEELTIDAALGRKVLVDPPKSDIPAKPVEQVPRFCFQEGLVPQAVWRQRRPILGTGPTAKFGSSIRQAVESARPRKTVPFAERESARREAETVREVEALTGWSARGVPPLGESDDESAAGGDAEGEKGMGSKTAAAAEKPGGKKLKSGKKGKR